MSQSDWWPSEAESEVLTYLQCYGPPALDDPVWMKWQDMGVSGFAASQTTGVFPPLYDNVKKRPPKPRKPKR